MTALVDIDQLRTFIAIAETGSFTKAAEVVHKTQSAVSVQMKRLEEHLGCTIFTRDGRTSHLTEDGEQLLDYARRIVKLNHEALAAFSGPDPKGLMRLGIPDDYAESYLPDVIARFARSYPAVRVSIVCEPSANLVERVEANELDLAIVTVHEGRYSSEVLCRERLLWVTSSQHPTGHEDPLLLALGRSSNAWRQIALKCLDATGRSYRVIYTSSSAVAIGAVLCAGLGVSILPESGLRPWMRILTTDDGFPELPSCAIGLVRNPHEASMRTDALAQHIRQSIAERCVRPACP